MVGIVPVQVHNAKSMFEKALQNQTTLLGPNHPDTMTTRKWLTLCAAQSKVLESQRDISEAEARVREQSSRVENFQNIATLVMPGLEKAPVLGIMKRSSITEKVDKTSPKRRGMEQLQNGAFHGLVHPISMVCMMVAYITVSWGHACVFLVHNT